MYHKFEGYDTNIAGTSCPILTLLGTFGDLSLLIIAVTVELQLDENDPEPPEWFESSRPVVVRWVRLKEADLTSSHNPLCEPHMSLMQGYPPGNSGPCHLLPGDLGSLLLEPYTAYPKP